MGQWRRTEKHVALSQKIALDCEQYLKMASKKKLAMYNTAN